MAVWSAGIPKSLLPNRPERLLQRKPRGLGVGKLKITIHGPGGDNFIVCMDPILVHHASVVGINGWARTLGELNWQLRQVLSSNSAFASKFVLFTTIW